MTNIVFTSDVDWAPEAVIADTLALFERAGVRCTFFATHASRELAGCDKDLFEIGVHPNFNPLLDGAGGSAGAVLDEILAIYPEAKGVRSHSMTQSTSLLVAFAERGLLYDANHFLPYGRGIRPFRLWTGMVRIPYNWEDDIHWSYGRSFDDSGLDLDGEGLNVLDFHPVHIFLNTENKARYDAAKGSYHEPRKLAEYRNTTSVPGARDLLVALLDRLADRRSETIKMSEIIEHYHV